MTSSIQPLDPQHHPVLLSRREYLTKELYKIIGFVNQDHDILSSWVLGGATALILQINHRESHDLDIFVDDPQILQYVTAVVAELGLETMAFTYQGDGTSHLKVICENIGEIDFIVAPPITDSNSKSIELLGRKVEIETAAEVIAKKIRFRGESIKPLDILDIAAATETGHAAEIRTALCEISYYRDRAAQYLDLLDKEYVSSSISRCEFEPKFRDIAVNALEITRHILHK